MTLRTFTTRRSVLRHLGYTLCGSALSTAARAVECRNPDSTNFELSVAVQRLIAHPESAAVIGRCYLAQCGDEGTPHELTRRILESVAANGKTLDERLLLDRIHEDFVCGDIVTLDGWLLSRTEARLCALYSV